MTEPVQHLAALYASSLSGLPVPEETTRWVAGAIQDVVNGRARSLDGALGLEAKGHGTRPKLQTFIRQLRDESLAKAYRLCPGKSEGERKAFLATEILAVRELWPQWKALDVPPLGVSLLRAHLFHAFKLGQGKVPTSTRQLHDCIYGASSIG